MALGCGCGLIDSVVGCSGLLWVVPWVEVVGLLCVEAVGSRSLSGEIFI